MYKLSSACSTTMARLYIDYNDDQSEPLCICLATMILLTKDIKLHFQFIFN